MEEYHSNAKKDKAPAEPEPRFEKAIEGDVGVKKPGIGRKVKNLFIEADFKSVVSNVFAEVLIPAAKGMIYDGFMEGVGRAMYGSSGARRGRGWIGQGTESRFAYNKPVERDYNRGMVGPRAPEITQGPRRNQMEPEDVIFPTRAKAEHVLETLSEGLQKYEVVSVADFFAVCGLPSSFTDNNWGWVSLVGSQVGQIREGWVLDLPRPEPISTN